MKEINQHTNTLNKNETGTDLVCFCHLRWNFVYQRPQHLLSRFSNSFRTFVIEEPVFDGDTEKLNIAQPTDNLWVVTPHLPHGLSQEEVNVKLNELVSNLFAEEKIEKYIFWYYTPMALKFSSNFSPELIIYDCMDELSSFKFAPPELKELENELFDKADVVFTGGHSLYQAKKDRHHNIHPFPSSIDRAHFAQAKSMDKLADPADQASIPHPRIGFYGVIDERFDLDLIDQVAKAKPEWQFVIIGPVVKIDPATIPNHPNIHCLGSKTYDELPKYMAGWDLAMIPFALNESTRYISPTKTPEYLAAGLPVISTSITDVVSPYGDQELVYIADTPEAFIQAAETELSNYRNPTWATKVEAFISEISWDKTWSKMMDIIEISASKKKLTENNSLTNLNQEAYV